jgi:Zn-dependent metalloprotease
MRRLLLVAATLPALALAACDSSTPAAPGGTGGTTTGSDDETVPQFAGNRLTRVDWTGSPVTADPLAFLARAGVAVDHLQALRNVTDTLGRSHIRVQQTIDGIPVMGGDAIVHIDTNGDIYATTGNLVLGVNVATTAPSIRPDQAQEALLAYLAQTGVTDVTIADLATPSLLIVPTATGDRLVWNSSNLIESKHADAMQLEVMIDAIDGSIVQVYDALRSEATIGTGKSLYLGQVAINTNHPSSYEMRDTTRAGTYTMDMKNRQVAMISVFTDSDNVWGNFLNSDRASAAVDAHYGAQETWDYYLTTHGRTGIDGNGRASSGRVHYSRGYNNAYWSDSCFCMTYGDGDGKTFSPLVSLDVTGHEMSHGVTASTANLTYSGESGGLNEATSDIFGTCVEFFAANANDPGDYLIGEKITLKKLATKDPGDGKYLRSMIHPTWDGKSVDNYSKYTSTLDVHYSSGIANNVFYLMAEGGMNDTSQLSVAAGGIGRAKAEQIWYRALTLYMTSSTNFAGARAATLLAAADLYGGVGSPDYNTVADAWTAVGVP